MKKRIIDLLGNPVKEYRGEKYLCYIIRNENGYESKKKRLSNECLELEIEEEWQDCRLPLPLTALTTNHVGIKKIIRRGHPIEEAKKWVFGSILYGILVRECIPQTPVLMFVEDKGEEIIVSGMCEVVDMPKKGIFSKLKYSKESYDESEI